MTDRHGAAAESLLIRRQIRKKPGKSRRMPPPVTIPLCFFSVGFRKAFVLWLCAGEPVSSSSALRSIFGFEPSWLQTRVCVARRGASCLP